MYWGEALASDRMRLVLDAGRRTTGAGGVTSEERGVCKHDRECACVVVCAAAATRRKDAFVRVCGRQEKVWWHWPGAAYGLHVHVQ